MNKSALTNCTNKIIKTLNADKTLEPDLKIIIQNKLQRYQVIDTPNLKRSEKRQNWLKMSLPGRATLALQKMLAYQPSPSPTEVTFDNMEELIKDTADHYRSLDSKSSGDN